MSSPNIRYIASISAISFLLGVLEALSGFASSDVPLAVLYFFATNLSPLAGIYNLKFGLSIGTVPAYIFLYLLLFIVHLYGLKISEKYEDSQKYFLIVSMLFLGPLYLLYARRREIFGRGRI